MRNRLTTLFVLVLVLSFPVLLKAQEVASMTGVKRASISSGMGD